MGIEMRRVRAVAMIIAVSVSGRAAAAELTVSGADECVEPTRSSDRVRIVLDATGEGTLAVGDAALDPTPTDPNVPLPGKPGSFHDGFLYPIHAATVDAGRIRFEIDPGERYSAWCAIQMPYAYSFGPQYICANLPDDYELSGRSATGDTCFLGHIGPDGGVSAGDETKVSCARYWTCVDGVCGCTASSCAYDPSVPRSDDTYRVDIDGALEDDGASLVGTLAIHTDWNDPNVADRMTIRLQRQCALRSRAKAPPSAICVLRILAVSKIRDRGARVDAGAANIRPRRHAPPRHAHCCAPAA